MSDVFMQVTRQRRKGKGNGLLDLREGACEVLGRSPPCLGKQPHIVSFSLQAFLQCPVRIGRRSAPLLCALVLRMLVRIALRVFFVCTESFLHAIVFVFNPSVVSTEHFLSYVVRA